MDITRGQIQDAIEHWRGGQTFGATHPLAGLPPEQLAIFWNDDAMKDLARVIFHTLDGKRDIPSVQMPW